MLMLTLPWQVPISMVIHQEIFIFQSGRKQQMPLACLACLFWVADLILAVTSDPDHKQTWYPDDFKIQHVINLKIIIRQLLFNNLNKSSRREVINTNATTAFQLIPTDFASHFLSFCIFSRQNNPTRKLQDTFPLVYFSRPQLTLCIYKVQLHAVLALSFQRGPRQVFLFVQKWEKKFASDNRDKESTVYYSF